MTEQNQKNERSPMDEREKYAEEILKELRKNQIEKDIESVGPAMKAFYDSFVNAGFRPEFAEQVVLKMIESMCNNRREEE